MNTNEHELIFKHEVFSLVGCAMEVLNELGHGFLEKPYENALTVEFKTRKIPYKQQQRFQIKYKQEIVGDYIPDLIVYDQIIVETKCIPKVTSMEQAQMINYLKVTGLKLGVILNFRNPALEWKRIVR